MKTYQEKTDIFVVYNELHQSINRERIIMIQQDSDGHGYVVQGGGLAEDDGGHAGQVRADEGEAGQYQGKEQKHFTHAH
jgi:hypothetical protein